MAPGAGLRRRAQTEGHGRALRASDRAALRHAHRALRPGRWRPRQHLLEPSQLSWRSRALQWTRYGGSRCPLAALLVMGTTRVVPEDAIRVVWTTTAKRGSRAHGRQCPGSATARSSPWGPRTTGRCPMVTTYCSSGSAAASQTRAVATTLTDVRTRRWPRKSNFSASSKRAVNSTFQGAPHHAQRVAENDAPASEDLDSTRS